MAASVAFGVNLTVQLPAGTEIKGISVSLGQPVVSYGKSPVQLAYEARVREDRESEQWYEEERARQRTRRISARRLRAHWSEEAEADLRAWHPETKPVKKTHDWKKEGF